MYTDYFMCIVLKIVLAQAESGVHAPEGLDRREKADRTSI